MDMYDRIKRYGNNIIIVQKYPAELEILLPTHFIPHVCSRERPIKVHIM